MVGGVDSGVELYLGTGGYSNEDWVGLLYPEGSKPGEWLKLYARYFNAVELNSSFYAIPGIKAFAGMVAKSEGKVRFAVKLHQSMTHTRDAEAELYVRLRQSVSPLRDAGVLGPFLAQFPYAFKRTPANRRYLKELAQRFEGEALAIEFRHASWDEPEVRAAFAEAGLIWVSVDLPPLPGLPAPALYATTEVAYLRMHGRNRAAWWSGKTAAERHDYLYDADELRPWIAEVLARADSLAQLYWFWQNTTKGHALKNAVMVQDLLVEAGGPLFTR